MKTWGRDAWEWSYKKCFRVMSPPGKELMRIVPEKKLNHGGHPVLRRNFDNVYVRTDPAGNIKPDKERSTEKIDGAVALIMALDRAMKNGGRRWIRL